MDALFALSIGAATAQVNNVDSFRNGDRSGLADRTVGHDCAGHVDNHHLYRCCRLDFDTALATEDCRGYRLQHLQCPSHHIAIVVEQTVGNSSKLTNNESLSAKECF